jgi:hypothetical protein
VAGARARRRLLHTRAPATPAGTTTRGAIVTVFDLLLIVLVVFVIIFLVRSV